LSPGSLFRFNAKEGIEGFIEFEHPRDVASVNEQDKGTDGKNEGCYYQPELVKG
jgi:hypothetical protein